MAVAFFLLTSTAVIAKDIRVRVLDGRSGMAISGERVQVWVNARLGKAIEILTDANGIADLKATAGSSLLIESNLYHDCRPFEKQNARPAYSIDEILHTGLATPNSCGKIRPELKPGELIFFVRPLRLWDGLRR